MTLKLLLICGLLSLGAVSQTIRLRDGTVINKNPDTVIQNIDSVQKDVQNLRVEIDSIKYYLSVLLNDTIQ
jgi:hypothetical protein